MKKLTDVLEEIHSDPRSSQGTRSSLLDSILANAPRDDDGVVDPEYIANLITGGFSQLVGAGKIFKPEVQTHSMDALSLIAGGVLDFFQKEKTGKNAMAWKILKAMVDKTTISDRVADYVATILSRC